MTFVYFFIKKMDILHFQEVCYGKHHLGNHRHIFCADWFDSVFWNHEFYKHSAANVLG